MSDEKEWQGPRPGLLFKGPDGNFYVVSPENLTPISVQQELERSGINELPTSGIPVATAQQIAESLPHPGNGASAYDPGLNQLLILAIGYIKTKESCTAIDVCWYHPTPL
jgi:hypothetical protein